MKVCQDPEARDKTTVEMGHPNSPAELPLGLSVRSSLCKPGPVASLEPQGRAQTASLEPCVRCCCQRRKWTVLMLMKPLSLPSVSCPFLFLEARPRVWGASPLEPGCWATCAWLGVLSLLAGSVVATCSAE